MIERSLCLEKYGHPENKHNLPIKYVYPIPRTREAWEEKSIVYFSSKSNLTASVLTRKVELFCLPTLNEFPLENKSYSDMYYIAWKTLKERGLPVVSSVRKVDHEIVATTNLCADEVTSVYDQKIDIAEIRDTFPMDGLFVKIPIEELKNKADKLVNLSNKMGVELMSDGPFHVVVQQDGSWYLILLDIGKVRIHSRPENISSSAKKDNVFYVHKAVIAFARIQQNIRSLREARGLS
ncbi:MAG: hypothetical protein WCW14_03435 [Candidatus Paceibacterota bacterium]|jgi:hypothetical protein